MHKILVIKIVILYSQFSDLRLVTYIFHLGRFNYFNMLSLCNRALYLLGFHGDGHTEESFFNVAKGLFSGAFSHNNLIHSIAFILYGGSDKGMKHKMKKTQQGLKCRLKRLHFSVQHGRSQRDLFFPPTKTSDYNLMSEEFYCCCCLFVLIYCIILG